MTELDKSLIVPNSALEALRELVEPAWKIQRGVYARKGVSLEEQKQDDEHWKQFDAALIKAKAALTPAPTEAVLDNTHEQMNPKVTGNLCGNCGHSLYYHSKEMGCHVSRGSFNDGKRCHNTVPYHCQEFQPAEGMRDD